MLVLAAVFVAGSPPREARAQCAAATQPTVPVVPAETTQPVLVTLPPPGATPAAVAPPIDAVVAASPTEPTEPIIIVGESPCGAARIVVQQSVVVNATPAVAPPAGTVVVEPEEEPFEPAVAFEIGGFGDRVDLSGIGFTFDTPDSVPAVVRDLRIELAGDAPLTLGGASFAISGRPQPWPRGPELRISLGGGSFGGRPLVPVGAPNDVSLSVGSVFVFRLEGAFGLQHSFGPIGFYALGRIGWGAYFVSARTQEARLGDLGEDTLSAHVAELGTTVGVSVLLGGGWHLEAAWRRTFTGATGDGLLIGLSAELPADE